MLDARDFTSFFLLQLNIPILNSQRSDLMRNATALAFVTVNGFSRGSCHFANTASKWISFPDTE